MTPDLSYDFVVNRDDNSLTTSRDFAAPRQLVWDCHTRSELLDQWFAPKPMTTSTGSMAFREGGHWHYAMVDPSGPDYRGRIDDLTIAPIDGYTALDGFADATGALNPDLPQARWDVSFTEAGPHCRVRTLVRYDSTEDLDKVVQMGMEAGMTSTLDRLDDLLRETQRRGGSDGF